MPVLLNEAIKILEVKADGVYVDCTFGGGGHSKAILERMNKHGKLIAFDRDGNAQTNTPEDNRFEFIQQNFRYIKKCLQSKKVEKVDGIIADLGVSSYQIDTRQRGFSTKFDEYLDMRMNVCQSKTAASVLNNYSKNELHKVFEKYGELRNAKTLASFIIEKRKQQEFSSIKKFKMVIKPLVKGNPNRYYSQVFQALRIEVNEEISSLKELLEQVPELLRVNGIVAIISFHSIEDRIVKKYFKGENKQEDNWNLYMINRKHTDLEIITPKPIVPNKNERKINKRARSAKLRAAKKIMKN